MPFQRPTLQTIIDRMTADAESRITGNAALLRFGIIRILIKVFAGAIHITYGFIEFISKQLFITTAETEYLNRHGTIWAVNRKAASFATGEFTFAGVNGTLVPIGTKVLQSLTGIEYETSANGTVAVGTVTVAGIAIDSGEDSNTASAPVVELATPITGITGVTVSTLFTGGEDAETDDEYRTRILARIQEPPMGGTAEDYEFWALEVSGVDKAWTYPVTPGPGQVTVAFRGSASEATVKAYIDTKAPVTSDNFAQEVVDTTIDFTMWITPDTADFRTAIENNLSDYFESEVNPGVDIPIQQINNAISSTGVSDFLISSISGTSQDANGNLLFSGYNYGVLGTITFS